MVIRRIVLVATSAVVPAVGSLAVTDEQARFALILASVVATVAGGIAWVDKRIKDRIQEHTDTENKQDALRHAAVMSEIRHVREMLRKQ